MDNKQFEQYNFPKEKFAFATQGDVIHDKKLDTKAVSYARDSFRRFCKNKASVVAAILLGILILLAIFVPVFSPYDLGRVSTTEQFLSPKLFPSGTGFWDGTVKYSHVAYDVDNELPAMPNVVASAVMNLVVDEEPTLTNQASAYGKGGYVMFENESTDGKTIVKLYNYFEISATADGQYVANVVFGDKADALGSKLGEYRITFVGADNTLVLRDWTTDYTDATLDISSALTNAGLSALQGKLTFELKSIAGSKSYILIESCVFSAAEGASDSELLESISFADATNMVLRAKNAQNEFPDGYWQTVGGRKGVFESKVYFCDYVYDTYEAVYGRYEVVYAKSELDNLVKQGLCEYNYDVANDEFTFTKLSDDCPLEDVIDYKINTRTNKIQEVTGIAMRYHKMGYDTMPKYIFGTDGSGIDVATRVFYGLRTSLLLGVCTFLFCFFFGLVWGAISGYFGGIVDLSMERFTDILGGVPSLVVLTLCILHLGNNFVTFFLALCMTGWMGTAALTRTQFYRFKNMEHVMAARTLGASDGRLIFKHILPNSLGTIITSSAFMITSVIYTEATLAYLNLGLKGTHSFGVFLANNQQFLKTHPYVMIIPAVIMTLLMISFNLFANGLRDAVNPTLKGSE